MKKINEIFYSIQGEGHFTGTPAVFIRFSGCNLKCDFCDTAHQEGEWMSEDAIVEKVRTFPARHVVLTGGEPGLFITDTLIERLKAEHFFIQIETNGTRKLPDGIDWVTCSPKPGGELKVTHIDELKVVYTGQDMQQYDGIEARIYALQPCSGKNTNEVITYLLEHPRWRLSLQTHKILDVR